MNRCLRFWILLPALLLAVAGCAKQPMARTADGTDATTESGAAFETLLECPQTPLREWKYVVLHHTATQSGDVASIDRIHKQRRDANGEPWKGIGYHFLIGNGDGMPDGAVAATFRWVEQADGAHAGSRDYNQYGIGICLVGNFEDHPPTPAQLAATSRLIALLRREFALTDQQILRHQDLKPTACPGRLFPFEQLVLASTKVQQQLVETPTVPDRECAEPVSMIVFKEGTHVGTTGTVSNGR
ncbi:MAG: N-acetylmuramoyl-L-alanine amidase [Planctomycetaceae bacterium]|nr:N-acetylmuramoyl-L-alanine amidase [Planctomycetaceae bacterium]